MEMGLLWVMLADQIVHKLTTTLSMKAYFMISDT